MTELVGDPCIPSELIIPIVSTTDSTAHALSGSLVISGSKLAFYTGSAWETVSSA